MAGGKVGGLLGCGRRQAQLTLSRRYRDWARRKLLDSQLMNAMAILQHLATCPAGYLGSAFQSSGNTGRRRVFFRGVQVRRNLMVFSHPLAQHGPPRLKSHCRSGTVSRPLRRQARRGMDSTQQPFL